MSIKHPVFAITGSSGAGTTTVRQALEHIFRRQGLNTAIVEGDCFHRFDRVQMRLETNRAALEGRHFSHFAPEANHLDRLEALFRDHGESGGGQRRFYVHDEQEAEVYGCAPGTFTAWEQIAGNADLLFYEGLHGGYCGGDIDVARYVDLLVGVVPIINLEWIQKLHRDKSERGYTTEAVMDTVLRRMHDYIHYITPQFSRTHINFQRVPTVDTSNPFISRTVPALDESMVVVRFRDPRQINVDFPYLMSMIHDSQMSRRNTLVIPGSKMGFAMEVIIQPLIESMVTSGVVRYP